MCAGGGVGLRYYKVPQDLHGEEKLIGGVASLRQAAYVVVSFIVGVLVAWPLPISLVNKAGVASLLVVPGIALGFVTVQGMNLDQFVALYYKYYRRRKHFKYERRRRIW